MKVCQNPGRPGSLSYGSRFAVCLLTAALPIAFGQASLTTAQIAKRVSPSVVIIHGKTGTGDLLGSGFIISKDGRIVTNLHVIKDLNAARVQLANGEVFDSLSVVATDNLRDLAIIQIAGFNLAALDLGNSDAVAPGEPVVIVGSPLGLEGTITAGVLSAIRDSGEGFKVLQTDAASNPGNSGGPLVNNKGQAIGVVSFKLLSSEGLNFAIPINYVRGLLNALHPPMTLEQMRSSLVGAASMGHQESEGPSLKETLGWLREKIPLGTTQYNYYANRLTESVNVQSAVWSLDSCASVFGFVVASTEKFHPEWPPSIMTVRYTVPLGVLTSTSVLHEEAALTEGATFISGDRWVYGLYLFAKTKEILATSSSSEPSIVPSKATSSYFLRLIFNDENLARRIGQAFEHAAGLCRKKEPF